MRKIKALAIFNALALLIHIAFAYFVQTKQFNQQDVGEISAKYESLFTPAGMTFGIWGIIYTLLALLCLYHIVIAYKHDKNHPANTELVRMDVFFILVNLASAAWLVAWTKEQLLGSLLLIFLQLTGLITIHIRLHLYDPLKISGLKLSTQFPLSVYLGWISIAAIANTSSYLTATQWDGFGIPAVQWVIIMISISVLLSAIMILGRRNIYFGLVVAWGLYGIIIKRELVNPDLYAPVIITAWAAIGLIVLFAVLQLIRNITYKKPGEIFPSPAMPVK